MSSFKEIKVPVYVNENYTAASLMKRYADSTPNVYFKRGCYGEAILYMGGEYYTYHHWKEGSGVVTLYLEVHHESP